MSKVTKSTGRKRKAIRRLSIRLTTCDAVTLRRLSRASKDKAKPSAIVRDLIRFAGQALDMVESLAAASGKSRDEVGTSMADAALRSMRECADCMQPVAPSSASAAGAEDLL